MAWEPSERARNGALAAMRTVVYRNAPIASDVPAQYRGLTRTQLPADPKLEPLRTLARSVLGSPTLYSSGRSRPMLPMQRLDMHQAGRALDIMVPRDERGPGRKGWDLANKLAERAASLEVQFIVHNGYKWGAASGWGRYTGPNNHADHVHVEVTAPAGSISVARPTRGRDAPVEDGAPAFGVWTGALIAGGVVLAAAGSLAFRKFRK